MLRPLVSLTAVIAVVFLAGCATQRPLPKWEKPLARSDFQTIRTTAYTHSESDHLQYGRKSALGSTLLAGRLNSASADWGRWPAGTVFRVIPTGETYVVDDYGWALAGTNTIDLYKPTRSDMNRWGVRRVDIQILQWGSAQQSYSTLLPRSKHRHVQRMLKELRAEI